MVYDPGEDLINWLMDDDMFYDYFCYGCPDKHLESDTGAWDCPTGLDPSDCCCSRRLHYNNVLAILRKAGSEIDDEFYWL